MKKSYRQNYYSLWLLTLVFFIYSCTNLIGRNPAGGSVNYSNGLIPLEFGARPATDLIYNGELLLPDEALKLVQESEGKFDLSTLNPDQTSVLWKDLPLPISLGLNDAPDTINEDVQGIRINAGDKIEYLGVVPSRSGNFRITVKSIDSNGNERTYIIMLSKQIHNILLRKNLLRKLGYKIPPIRYFSKLNLKFSDIFAKETFFTNMAESTFGDPGRWIEDYVYHQREENKRPGGDLKILQKSESDPDFFNKEQVSIINQKSGKCIGRDIRGDGKNIRQYECKGDLFYALNWVLEEKEDNFFAIRSAETGKCLEINHMIKSNGGNVTELPCNYKDNQLFKIVKKENNTSIIIAKHSNKCLVPDNENDSDHVKLEQWTCDFKIAQEFRIEERVNGDGKMVDKEDIDLMDVVVMESQAHYYNLALGYLPPEVIQGRRILNSLLVPYSLVETPESINLFPWHSGRVINQQVKLSMENSENFSTSFEDAKWITRRILKLTPTDWEEIVKASHFPPEVGLLLKEKLISRRNHLKSLFNMDHESDDIPYNPNITSGKKLKKGKLLVEDWEGYGSRFSFGDPENPLSGSEIGHFIGSKIVSSTLTGMIDQLNSRYLNNQSMLESAKEFRNTILQTQLFLNYLETGDPGKIPLGLWVYPTFGGNILANRDVVIGSYLGVDNMIQLADTIGFNVSAGMYAHLEGLGGILPAPFSMGVSANTALSFTRTYTHLKPIMSFKAANRYPFKNILVPLLEKKYANFFREIMDGRIGELEEEEKSKKITELVSQFKKELAIGESLIISDNLTFGLNIGAGVGTLKVLSLNAIAGDHNLIISRLHIFRKDENTIQIYRDLGNINSFILSTHMKALVPVLGLSINFSKGKARVKYFDLNIEADKEKNPNIIKNIFALGEVLNKNSTKNLEIYKKPIIVSHQFKETLSKAYFTLIEKSKLKGNDLIKVNHPQGHQIEFYQSHQVVRKGINIENYSVDAINAVLGEYTKWDVNLKSIGQGAPGDSLGGGQLLYQVTLEGELEGRHKKGLRKKGLMDQTFSLISRSFRGFSISKEKALKVLEKLNDRYGLNFFHKDALHQTERIFLYNIGVDLHIYQEGISNLANMEIDTFKKIIRNNIESKIKGPKLALMALHFKLFKYHLKNNNYENYTKYLRSVLGMTDRWVKLDGVRDLLGGNQNFFAISRINGFRIGDEDGDNQIISNSIGQIGSEAIFGPIKKLIQALGLSESEFFAYWLRHRLN